MLDSELGQIAKSIRKSQYLKVFLIGVLVLVLQIPIGLILGVIKERQHTRDSAIQEVTEKWGKTQNILGPRIIVPYMERWSEVDNSGHKIARSKTNFATFLPETLKITGKLDCEIRHRGIYQIPVYKMLLSMNGRFSHPDLEQWKVDPNDILWDQAYLYLTISDTHAVVEMSGISWNDENLEFLPSTGPFGQQGQGIHVKLKDHLVGESFNYSFPLVLNGSVGVYFAPFGKQSEITLDSNWAAPSFQGNWIPTERDFKEDGFKVTWKIPSLGRNYPQSWQCSTHYEDMIRGSQFGVNLIRPVDQYRMSHRSIKYQLLFILLTFASLWLFEVISKTRIHLIQYLLVGAGLCLFYLLEISLAEHIGFMGAYIIASAMIILLITFYSFALLKKITRAGLMGVIMSFLYAFLYTLLMTQDYSLLIGSIALFFILAVIMYLTRNIDWNSTIK